MSGVPHQFTTARLILRPFEADDAAAVWAYASDPAVTRYMDWPTHTDIAASRAFLAHAASAWRSGDEFTWAITERDGGDSPIGAIACRPRDHATDFGYVLRRSAWGRGFATQAATAVTDWIRTDTECERLWAICDVDNAASARVLEKAGLEREALLRRWSRRPNLPGRPARDVLVYAWIRP